MSKEKNVHLSPALTPSQTDHSEPSGNEIMPEGFIGKKEVARRLNKGIRTVDYWMERGILPYYKIGRSVEFKWSEIEAHLAQTCRVARAFQS